MVATSRQSKSAKLVGFGAPSEFGAHLFKVTIPPGRSGLVVLSEEYGFLAGLDGVPDRDIRSKLDRSKWTPLADVSRKNFNARLRANGSSPGTWKPQDNLLDRMLGKELAVLMWAAEWASDSQIETVCGKWDALRPEERWWLYAMTSAEAGLAEEKDRGWRLALFHALSDGKGSRVSRPKIVERDKQETLGLFS
nr:anti-phage-associated DUF3780 domain-containing protein [Ferrimicrobium acidiphilum]